MPEAVSTMKAIEGAIALAWSRGSLLLYDKESMGAVTLELFDETIFPIEIGLHRTRIDIGALIGTPVAM